MECITTAAESQGPEDGVPDPQVRATASLQAITARALRSNLSRVASLTEAVNAGVSGELDAAVRQAAAETAHQLVGSAGTFGYARASVLARELESYFGGSVVTENDWSAAFRIVQTLGEVLQAGPDADNEEEEG